MEHLKVLKSDENEQNIKQISEIFPKKIISEIFPKKMKTSQIKSEIDEIEKWEEKIKREDLKYETKRTYGFHKIFWRKYLYS